MPPRVCERRVGIGTAPAAVRVAVGQLGSTDTDRENTVGPEMNGRAERCHGSQTPVRVISIADANRREEYGNGARCHDVINREALPNSKPSRAHPRRDVRSAFEEGHAPAGSVIRRGQGEAAEHAARDAFVDRLHVEALVEQRTQRLAHEERLLLVRS
jgi:hypothetical protein